MEIFDALWCALVKLINFLVEYVFDVIISAIAWAIALLPTIPILAEPIDWGPFGDAVGYFLPVADMITHFSMMLILIIAWYGVQHILRIVRAIK